MLLTQQHVHMYRLLTQHWYLPIEAVDGVHYLELGNVLPIVQYTTWGDTYTLVPYLWPTHTKGGLGSVGSKVPIYVGLG